MKSFFNKLVKESASTFYDHLDQALVKQERMFIVTANPETFMIADRDASFRRLLEDEQTTVVADGIGIVKAANMLSIPVPERIPGIEIAQQLMQLGNQRKASIYLFGAKPEVIEAMKLLLAERYPHLCLVGCCDGYVKDKDRVFDEIVNLQPDIVLVALGIPAQEQLIYRHLYRFTKGIFVGVGGSFDVMSGMKKRAPSFFIRCNLEWLYRLGCEPKRWKRFYQNNIKFIGMVRGMRHGGK